MARLRDLGFTIGRFPTGSSNTIADVAGVTVGHATVVRDEPAITRTGVTIVQPRPPGERDQVCYGGLYSFNGNGEMTGSHWLDESGLLAGPIGITNTHQVGLVRDQIVAEILGDQPSTEWCLPIVGETYDGFLNDIAAFALTADDVQAALADADADRIDDGGEPAEPVAEGNVGGGTGMICHGFKGGIGTSSRVVEHDDGPFTVAALVQANYGARELLRLEGRPVGELIGPDVVPLPDDPSAADAGSIIVIIATDAPLLADQCKRLARRATVGLARVGGTGASSSGDIFVAFATGNRIPAAAVGVQTVRTLAAVDLTPFFNATAEAVEESIWNALCQADTMTGHQGRTVHAIPHAELRMLA